MLLQSIESSIGLVTGADGYSNTFSYYCEQLGNPSLSSPHLLTARAVARLLRGEVTEAKSDLEEAMHAGEDEETLMASVVAAGLQPAKKGEADELYAYVPFSLCVQALLTQRFVQRTCQKVPFVSHGQGLQGEEFHFRFLSCKLHCSASCHRNTSLDVISIVFFYCLSAM